MNIEVQQILTQIAGFFILLWLMKRFAWRPLLALLDERHRRITAEFDEAARIKAEFAALEREYATKCAEIETQARARLLEAVQEGERLSREIQDKGREEAKKNLEQLRESLQLEVRQAHLTLRTEIANLAILAAEQILKEHLDDARQQALVTRFLDELGAMR